MNPGIIKQKALPLVPAHMRARDSESTVFPRADNNADGKPEGTKTLGHGSPRISSGTSGEKGNKARIVITFPVLLGLWRSPANRGRVMPSNEAWIVGMLLDHGKEALAKPRQPYSFLKNELANKLIDNLEQYPHAFALACAMERGGKSERAWLIPYLFKEKLGGDFSISRLVSISMDDIKRIMTGPPAIHRFPELMSRVFYAAVHRISSEYSGDASRIWRGEPLGALVVYRFLEFEGIGPKIANMAANTLARDYKIRFADYQFLDISADVHVRRVFGRLGLSRKDPTVDQVIFRARVLHPKYPGLLDLPCWEIGREWCKPREPLCESCYMNEKCPTATELRRVYKIEA
jgi:endonuclease-3